MNELDERVGGQPAALGVVEEVIEGRELGGEPLVETGRVDHSRYRQRHPGVHVDPPREPCGIESLEDGLGVVLRREAVVRRVHQVTGRGACVVERPVRGVCEGTSHNQWSKVPNPLAMVEMTGICSGV